MLHKPTALIFRERLLPISETFIHAQASALHRYDPVFTGFYREKISLPLPSEPIILSGGYNQLTRRRVWAFHQTRWAPMFLKRIERTEPKIIHAHFAPDGAAALTLARGFQLPLIVTLHGFDVSVRMNYAEKYAALWEHASRFLCVSDFIRQKAIEAGFPEHKLQRHYIGIDMAHFARSSPRKNFDRGKILFVGRLVEKKGCTYLIEALQKIQQKRPDSHAVIIGDGPLRESLQQQARGLRCQFLGSQAPYVIRQQLESAAVFCAPSVTASNGDSEGLPMVLLEAAALAVPAVSTMHSGIVDAVVNGSTGLLVPERDARALAEAIERYLEDDDFRMQCADRAVEHVRQRFDLLKQTAHLEDIYDDLSTNLQNSRNSPCDSEH